MELDGSLWHLGHLGRKLERKERATLQIDWTKATGFTQLVKRLYLGEYLRYDSNRFRLKCVEISLVVSNGIPRGERV